MKRSFTLIFIFTMFYSLIIFVRRSLIYWGFIILTNILIYLETSFESKYRKKKFYWMALIGYSSIIILINTVFIFCQMPYMQKLAFI